MTIKVLQFICPVGFYGAERWILALANNLDPSIVRCDLAVTRESDHQDLSLVSHFPETAGMTHELTMRNAFDPGIFARMNRLIRDRNIDIIHTHGYKSDIIGLVCARMTGIPCVSTPHGFGAPKNLKSRIYNSLGCRALRRFDVVAPLSEGLMAELAPWRIAEHRLQLIMNGVDLTEVDQVLVDKPEVSPALPAGFRIGYVGRFSDVKRIDLMINAFNLAWRDNSELQLVLVGDGGLRPGFEAHAKTLECAENVHFLGYRDDRLAVLRELDAFCMTSESEGIPRSMMEAMGMGVPVVAFDAPGVDRLVKHDNTGLLAPHGDLAALAGAMQALAIDEALARRLSASARTMIDEVFSGKRMAQTYTEVFQRLLR